MISEQLKHYTDAEDYNQLFYHHRDEGADKRQKQFLLTYAETIIWKNFHEENNEENFSLDVK